MYSHLRCHSTFSFLRGVTPPNELAKAAAREGMPALALTDFHSLTGAVEFYDECHDVGIQPIIGLELLIDPPPGIICQPGVVTLLAFNLQGWSNLCRLSSISIAGSTLPFTSFTQHISGLICLTGGLRGSLTHLIRSKQRQNAISLLSNLQSLFNTDLFVELQIHSPEDRELCEHTVMLAARCQVPTVVTHDIHYLTPEQAHLQMILSAIRTNQSLEKLSYKEIAPSGAFFASAQLMEGKFSDFPKSLERTAEIVEQCQLDLSLGVSRYPQFESPQGLSSPNLLRKKAEAGALNLYGRRNAHLPNKVRSRLDQELGIISECGYAPLFLIVEEILGFAREEGIPYSSRGSAASSLVAHCLGLTAPDPIRLNLYFERFLNPARATPPDIDIDICSRDREQVILHVYEQYGVDRVATVCTISCFRSRSALRETAKVYNLTPMEINRLTDGLPNRWYRPGSDQKNQRNNNLYDGLIHRYTSPHYHAIFSDAQNLDGVPHHLSVHPGGIVISPTPMTDWVPTQMASKGVIITQLDFKSIERLGLIKIDLLGIRGLTVLGEVIEEAVLSSSHNTPNYQQEDIIHCKIKKRLQVTESIESIPEFDTSVSEMISSGNTIGCFQIESPGMRNTLKEIRAKTIDDIMIALALYRPGPLTGGLKNAFIQRHLRREADDYLHPSLVPLLQDTHGVILYQEQVLQIAHDLSGLSMIDADLLRRAMSHFDPGKQMHTLKEKFIDGAYKNNHVPEDVSMRIWDLMSAFAGYGFPKAHAASYALISWRSAWCKSHHPAFFMAAVLANWGGYYSQRVYLTEARRLGLSINPPHINYAQPEFSVKFLGGELKLFMGLNQVRQLSRATQEAIIRCRPFNSLMDFLVRVDPNHIEAKNLIEIGALDGFGSIPNLLNQVESGTWSSHQYPLFRLNTENMEDWSLIQKTAAQMKILGASVSAHPLEIIADQVASAGTISTIEASDHLGEKVRVAGLRQTWHRSQTDLGGYLYILALEDLDGYIDVLITSNVYHRYKITLNNPGPFIIEGIIEFNNTKSEPYIRADKIWKI